MGLYSNGVDSPRDGISTRLHDRQHIAPSSCNPPAAILDCDERLRNYVQVRYAGREHPRSTCPIGAARREDSHVVLEFGCRCETFRIADQNLQYCYLKFTRFLDLSATSWAIEGEWLRRLV